jgi:hypothetical protein
MVVMDVKVSGGALGACPGLVLRASGRAAQGADIGAALMPAGRKDARATGKRTAGQNGNLRRVTSAAENYSLLRGKRHALNSSAA